MPYSFYLFLHIISIIGLSASLTALLLNPSSKKITQMLLGIFSLLLLVAGFGMLAKAKLSMHASWVMIKLFIWISIAVGIPIIAKRAPKLKKQSFYIAILGLTIAAYLGIFHN